MKMTPVPFIKSLWETSSACWILIKFLLSHFFIKPPQMRGYAMSNSPKKISGHPTVEEIENVWNNMKKCWIGLRPFSRQEPFYFAVIYL